MGEGLVMEHRPNCQSAESEPRAQFSMADRRMQGHYSSLVLHWTREDSFSSLVLHWPLQISPFAYRACSLIHAMWMLEFIPTPGAAQVQ